MGQKLSMLAWFCGSFVVQVFLLQFRLKVFSAMHFYVVCRKINGKLNFWLNFLLFLFHWLVMIRYDSVSLTYWFCVCNIFLICSLHIYVCGQIVFYCLCCLIICWMLSWFEEMYRLKWYICIFWNSLQTVRVASMKCIDELRALWCRIEISGKKNGTSLSDYLYLTL